MSRKLIIFSLAHLLAFTMAFANGGDQRVVDGRYIVNLSKSPFTPKINEQNAMLISFFDISKNEIISEPLLANIRIAKITGTDHDVETVFTKDNIEVVGGISEFSYTFKDSGLHAIFIDFALATSTPEWLHAPDFLIDVQKAEPPPFNPPKNSAVAGILFSLVVGFFLGTIVKKKIAK